ncbi:uncharacterized protein LOC143193097 [Rhynchophorus ferrugineus]|uniref:Protein sleepless n=1 Tax=Rhynchophorus ferrugineus TaxID=354439 RepID=A0A834IMY6_RHYFE|nr:hypothetical protein GWI33_022668 [Rhynchophorus ferrugineus]
MNINFSFGVLAIIVCYTFTEVASLRCFECTESESAICSLPFKKDSTNITDCSRSIYTVDNGNDPPNREFVCLLIEEIDAIGENSTFTRRCSIKNSNDNCENIITKNFMFPDIKKTKCQQCEEDLCNSTPTKYSHFSIIALFLSFVIFRM